MSVPAVAGESNGGALLLLRGFAREMAALRRRGGEFIADIAVQEWGWVTRFRIPGGEEVELYQPKYAPRRRRRSRGGAVYAAHADQCKVTTRVGGER